MKNRPGPFAPPGNIRPRRKITARSYSFTIFMQQHKLNGNVNTTRKYDIPISKYPQHPNPSSTVSLASSTE
jgi:hypothetical protein